MRKPPSMDVFNKLRVVFAFEIWRVSCYYKTCENNLYVIDVYCQHLNECFFENVVTGSCCFWTIYLSIVTNIYSIYL